MRFSLGDRLACTYRNRPEYTHRHDARTQPGTILGLDLTSGHMHDVGLDCIYHRANLFAVIRERERHASRTRTDSLKNRASDIATDCFSQYSGLTHHHTDKVSPSLGARQGIVNTSHAVDLDYHFPSPSGQ
jgi:hypothetical protein